MNFPTPKQRCAIFCASTAPLRLSALWRFMDVSKFPERGRFPGVCFIADASWRGEQRNIAMMTVHSPVRLRNAAAVLALALLAGPAVGQTTGAAPTAPSATTTMPSTMPATPPSTTTPGATMPNSNPYTTQQGISPNGTPAPNTANQYQQPSPLTPQQQQKQAVCPPNAARTTTTPTPPPCMPGQVPCP
jgi:hypothetical protein